MSSLAAHKTEPLHVVYSSDVQFSRENVTSGEVELSNIHTIRHRPLTDNSVSVFRFGPQCRTPHKAHTQEDTHNQTQIDILFVFHSHANPENQ